MILSIYIIAIVRFLMVFHLHSKLETIFAGLIVSFYGFFMSTFLTLWIKETDDIDTNHKIWCKRCFSRELSQCSLFVHRVRITVTQGEPDMRKARPSVDNRRLLCLLGDETFHIFL